MLHRRLIVISTLVLAPVLTIAAPHDPAPDLDQNPAAVTEDSEKSDALRSMEVTVPPQSAKRKTREQLDREYFYPYQSTMGPRLGLLLSSERIEDKEVLYLIGFYYMLPSLGTRHLEVGADLQSNQTGTINGGMKWIYNSTESFRPFSKAGLTMLVEPTKGLANAIDYHQYALRFGGGLEDVLLDPASLRWDLEFTVGFKEFSVNIVFGYSWGW